MLTNIVCPWHMEFCIGLLKLIYQTIWNVSKVNNPSLCSYVNPEKHCTCKKRAFLGMVLTMHWHKKQIHMKRESFASFQRWVIFHLSFSGAAVYDGVSQLSWRAAQTLVLFCFSAWCWKESLMMRRLAKVLPHEMHLINALSSLFRVLIHWHCDDYSGLTREQKEIKYLRLWNVGKWTTLYSWKYV